jgi:hypothetical protein
MMHGTAKLFKENKFLIDGVRTPDFPRPYDKQGYQLSPNVKFAPVLLNCVG